LSLEWLDSLSEPDDPSIEALFNDDEINGVVELDTVAKLPDFIAEDELATTDWEPAKDEESKLLLLPGAPEEIGDCTDELESGGVTLEAGGTELESAGITLVETD
jgi:hypothetical protein